MGKKGSDRLGECSVYGKRQTSLTNRSDHFPGLRLSEKSEKRECDGEHQKIGQKEAVLLNQSTTSLHHGQDKALIRYEVDASSRRGRMNYILGDHLAQSQGESMEVTGVHVHRLGMRGD